MPCVVNTFEFIKLTCTILCLGMYTVCSINTIVYMVSMV